MANNGILDVEAARTRAPRPPPLGPEISGELATLLGEPKRLARMRIWKRVAWPSSGSSFCTEEGTVTTTLVLLPESERTQAAPPPTRRKKTRVLPLPATKFFPVIVSFWPMLAFSGLIFLITGAVEASAEPAHAKKMRAARARPGRIRRVVIGVRYRRDAART